LGRALLGRIGSRREISARRKGRESRGALREIKACGLGRLFFLLAGLGVARESAFRKRGFVGVAAEPEPRLI